MPGQPQDGFGRLVPIYGKAVETKLEARDGDLFLSLPLVILAIFSIFFGYITKDIFIGLGSSFFVDNSLFIHPTHEIMIDTEFAVPTILKILPLILTVSLSGLALFILEFLPDNLINFKLSRLGYKLFGFFNQRFLIELFYNNYITIFILDLGSKTTKILDKGSIELIGPYGLENVLIRFSKNINSLSKGNVTDYALFILISFILYLIISSNINILNLIFLVLLTVIITKFKI